MYTVTLDGAYLHHPQIDDLTISNAVLELEVNKTGAFEFTIYPEHGLYGSIQRLKSIIEVYDDGYLIFRGRPLNDTYSLNRAQTIQCEGELAYLNDSQMIPYSHSGSVENLLRLYITNHNSQVDASKQFSMGNVTVTDPNNLIVRSSIDYVNTWAEISSKLIDSLGGYIRIRREGETNFIDYLQDSSTQSGQTIELSKNILDYQQQIDVSEIATVIIPLGAKIKDSEGNETDERLTISSVNGGLNYIEHTSGIAQYGKIWAVQIWDNVTTPQVLKDRGTNSLNALVNLGININIKAIDLSLVDKTIPKIKVFDYVRIISPKHNVDFDMLIKKQTIYVDDPSQNTIEVGMQFASFTDKQLRNDHVIRIIESNYVTNETVGEIRQITTTLQSAINQTAEAIDLMVSESNATIERVAELELTSENIRLEMAQIGGYNLISNVVGRYDYLDWTHSATPFIAKKTAPYAMVKTGLQPIYAMNNEQRNSYSVSTDLGSGNGIRFWKDGLRLSKIVPVDNGTDYSLYTKTKGTGTLTFKLREYASGTETNKNNFTKETVLGTTVATENWATFTHTITTQATTNSVCLVVQSNVDVYAQQYAIFSDTSFNIGQPKPFGESLTDVNNRVDSLRATVELNDDKVNIFTQRVQTVEGLVDNHSAQLTVQANQISSKVSSNGIISAINQTAETITIDASKINLTGQVSITTYNNKMTSIDNTLSSHGSTINSHTSSISSLGNEITLKVSKGDIASTINQTAQSVKIDASKINLSGYVTVTSIGNGTTSIDGSNIKTGTINADRIGAGTISANKLSVTSLSSINSNLGTVTAGSISGTSINIGSGNFTVNTSGVVVAKSITTTGTHGGTTNGRVNGTSGYHTGASTFTSTSGNFSSGTLGGSGYSASGSNASFSGRVVTLSGFSTAYTSYLGSILPNADTNTLGNFSTRWNKFFCQYPVDVSSDIRLKENFVDIHDDFNNFIYSLPIGTYTFKNDNIPQIGVNANFVDGMLPSEYTKYLITKGDNGYYSANYVALVPMLVKVVQSQNTRLIDLEYEVAKLKGGAK